MASKKTIKSPSLPKSDLASAKADLKAFRHDIAVLKKKGLIEKSLYDARTVKPTKYLKSIVKKFKQVLNGEAATVKVSKANAKYYKSKGYNVKNGRVVVPVMKNEKVFSTHGNFVVKATGAGGSITRIDLHLDPNDVSQWVDDLRNNRIKLGKDEHLAFQLFGYNAHQSFGNLPRKTAQEQMADYLEAYDIINGTDESTPERQVIQGITIFKIQKDGTTGRFPVPKERFMDYETNRERIEAAKQRRKESRARAISRMEDYEIDEMLEERAEKSRKKRERMSPEKREKYKQAARERALKSKAKNK